MSGWAALQAAGPDAVGAFLAAHDADRECSGCGRTPYEGCQCERRETPDLIMVLGRVPARRALERVAAAASGDRVAA